MPSEPRSSDFEMSYQPLQNQVFGAPLGAWLVPVLYACLSVTLMVCVLIAPHLSPASWLFRYIVEGDADRLIGAKGLATIVLIGGAAAIARTAMRGVMVGTHGVKARFVVGLGWPKVRVFSWVEIREVVLDGKAAALGLWDGDRFWLPDVANPAALRTALETAARTRSIAIRTGRTGN